MHDEKIKGWLSVTLQVAIIALLVLFSIYDAGSIMINDSISKTAGLIIILSGVVLMIITIISFNQMMTPSPVPKENYTLKTSGFYKYIRHPVYSFALLTLFGVVVYYRSISGFVFFIVAVCFLSVKIVFEETQLKKKFPDYNLYTRKTKKLIPFIY